MQGADFCTANTRSNSSVIAILSPPRARARGARVRRRRLRLTKRTRPVPRVSLPKTAPSAAKSQCFFQTWSAREMTSRRSSGSLFGYRPARANRWSPTARFAPHPRLATRRRNASGFNGFWRVTETSHHPGSKTSSPNSASLHRNTPNLTCAVIRRWHGHELCLLTLRWHDSVATKTQQSFISMP